LRSFVNFAAVLFAKQLNLQTQYGSNNMLAFNITLFYFQIVSCLKVEPLLCYWRLH